MADTQSFMKSLYYGVIPEAMVFPYPELGNEERVNTAMIVESVRAFAERSVDSAAIDRDECIPPSVLNGLRELGLFGMTIPAEYGGKGLSMTSYARVIEAWGGIDSSIALTLCAHQSLSADTILRFASEAIRKQYLPQLATGERIAAFALSEPGAGSDAAGVSTRARLEEDGKHYVLDGPKAWVTNGSFADIFIVFARTNGDDAGARPRMTAFLVERSSGVEVGPSERKLGVRGTSTTAVTLKNVRVPVENILGEVGRGFLIAVEALDRGRVALAASCVGASKRLVQMSVKRCGERRAFGRTIGEFGMVKDKVARMMIDLWALESMTYLTTGLIDAGRADDSIESAICKLFGSETLWRIVHEALQIAAGVGYMQQFPYERLLRDARASLIFEGTNEIMRAFIALSGMQGPGKKITEVAKAMREPIKGFGLLSEFAMEIARGALKKERLDRAHPRLRRETVLFEQFTYQLSQQVEKVLRRHGTDIAEMQYTQRRIADISVDLFALAAIIARTTRAIERKGEEGARREIELTGAFANAAEKRLKGLVASFDENDDELLKGIATRGYSDGLYPFDVL